MNLCARFVHGSAWSVRCLLSSLPPTLHPTKRTQRGSRHVRVLRHSAQTFQIGRWLTFLQALWKNYPNCDVALCSRTVHLRMMESRTIAFRNDVLSTPVVRNTASCFADLD